MTKRKTHEQYIQELKEINPNIECIGEYKNIHAKILHRCNIDGYEWEGIPYTLLQGCGCPKCGHKSRIEKCTKTHEEYTQELAIKNPNIECLGEYKNSMRKILHRCKIDEYKWEVMPISLLRGHGCPECARQQTESKGAKQIGLILDKYNIIHEKEKRFKDCKNKFPLPFDYCINTHNGVVLIEYQGGQHYTPISYYGGEKKFKLQQKRDQIKRDFCKSNNIPLFEIPYTMDLKDLEGYILKILNDYNCIKVKYEQLKMIF